jgi:type IV pilus assembly protein PilE
MRLKPRMRGMSLIELMIVMVIVAIMGMIAVPAYRGYVLRAQRVDATSTLLRVAANQERFYLQNNTYTCDMTRLGFSAAADFVTESGTYTVNVTDCTADNFTAQADYNPSDAEEGKCDLFQINGRNVKTSLPYTNCWTRTR